MLPDRVSNPGPLTYESGALPIALRGPARDIIWPRILLSFKETQRNAARLTILGIQLHVFAIPYFCSN